MIKKRVHYLYENDFVENFSATEQADILFCSQ